jgi:chemotaxis protein histidine kinase CheA
MPPRLDERTIKYLQGLQKRLEKEKKQNSESEYKALQYSEESYKKYLADKAQKEAEKKQAEEKAAADAKAKAAADAKARTEAAAKAKTEADAKAAKAKIAADERAKIAAEQAEKAKADAEILEQKKLQKAIDEAAKEERKKIRAEAEKVAAAAAAAEKERIRLEKKAQKKLEKAQAQAQIEASTNSHLSEKSNSSYASAKSHTSGLSTTDVDVVLPEPTGLSMTGVDVVLPEPTGLSPPLALSAKSPARTESLPIHPIDRNGAAFWSRFFTPGEIEELSRDVDCTSIDKTKFFIPEIQKKKNVKIGSVVVTPEQAISVNRVVCKLIRIFGIMEARFNERQFEFELIWKGTRAIMLATGVSIDTHDIDIEIINRDRREESIERKEEFKENRMRLASHICILIKDLLSDAPLSILYPGDQDAVNPDILKISYMVGPRYIPILDLCFNKTYTYRNEINKTDTIIADRNEKYIETTSKRGLYKHPSIASMKREKDEYLRNYTIENKRSDIDKMKAGLFKINFALGKTTDKSVDVRPKPLTEKEKKQLQELINERLAKSKTPSQSQKPSSNSTASKP